MTSLATQLKQLARPQTEAVQLREDPHRKSLLFDPKEAAKLDRETFYDIGINGLHELINLDSSFREFEVTLFDEASKSLERSVQSQEFNDSLDEKINKFLLLLMPYLPLKQAHKAIEWLVHRFHIYHYNIEGLMSCILPYYETNLFVRILQLIDISDPTSHWHWLHPLQTAGVSLSRTVLLNQCSSNISFLKFIGDILLKSNKAHGKLVEDKSSLLRVVIAFYASTFVGTLENLQVITENHISALLPYLLKGLRAKTVDYKAASYMVMCQLVAKANLKEEVLHPLINSLCKNLVPGLGLEGIACLASICQTQDISSIPEKAFKNICQLPALVEILEQLSTMHDIEPLMVLFLRPLICSTIEQADNDDNEDDMEAIKYSILLENILQNVGLNISSAKLVASTLLNGCIEYCSELDDEEVQALKKRLKKIMHILETRYATAMDAVMESFHTSEHDKKSKELAQDFLGLTVSGIKHQVLPESDTSLILSLNHPQPHAREVAVRRLLKNIKAGGDMDDFVVNAVFARMQDDDVNVILAALWCEESILCSFPAEQLFEALLSILKRWRGHTDPAWLKVGQRVLTLLTTSNLWSNNADIIDRALIALLPYLFPTTENFAARSKLTQIIVNAALTSHHSLLTNLASVYIVGVRDNSEKVDKINKSLIDLLGNNLATMNIDVCSRMTKLLYRCAKEEEGSKQPLRFIATAIATSMLQHSKDVEQRLEMCRVLVNFIEPEVIKICAIKGKKLTAILEEGATAISNNWSEDDLPSNFSTNLGVRLVSKKRSKVVGSHNIDVGLADVTLWSLSAIVKSIQLSDLPNTSQLWSFSGDNKVKSYFSLLKQLFSMFMSGATDSRASVFSKAFKDLSLKLFKLHLFDSSVLWEFFSTIWLEQTDNAATRVLTIHSLNVATATVKALTNEQVHKLLTAESIVFPALLGVLCSAVAPIRTAGVNLLHALKEKLEKDCVAAYSQLVRHLNKRREEIVADDHQLPQILSVFISKQSVSPSKQESKLANKQEALSALLHCLVGSLPSSVKHAVLVALQSTDEKVVVTHSYALLDTLLSNLVQCNSLSITDSENLAFILEHFTPNTADLMSGPCQDSYVKALGVDIPLAGGLGIPQEKALKQLTKAFFTAINSVDVQEQMLTKILDIVMLSTNPSTQSNFMKKLKKLPLSSEHLKNEFSKLEVTTKSSIRETRKARRLTQGVAMERQTIDKETLQRITFVIELIQQRKIKNIEDSQHLVPCLFTVLQRCLNVSMTEDHSSMEYLQQLVLTLLQNLCIHLSHDGQEAISPEVLSEDQINVELVVQCVRATDNPQTQNHALLFLGTLAKLFPERVLHNIMSIFTFMGAHLLRQDDNYSFQVIQRTIQTIIPTLVKANSSEEHGTLTTGTDHEVAMVLRVFVDALPHVPEHRQMMLFTELITTLGHDRYLWMLIILLLTSHVEKSKDAELKEEEETKLSHVFKLPLSLCHQSSAGTQLSMLTTLVKYLLTLPQEKPLEPQTPRRSKKNLKAVKTPDHNEAELFNVGNHSARQLRQFKFNTVSFIITLLASDEFVSQVANMSEVEVERLNPFYQSLIDASLQLITVSARGMEADAGKPTVKFWKAMIHKSYGIMDKVNSLLSMDLFVHVVMGLLSSPSQTIRRKALQLLNNKILQHMGNMNEEQVSLVLTLLDQLVTIAKSSPDDSINHDESYINQQTALYGLKIICKLAGTSHPHQFGPVVDAAIEIMMNAHSNQQVVSSACLLLGEVVRSMKAHTIPSIPRFMPSLLQQLENKETSNSSDLHLVSVLMAVYRVVETLPHFLNPYLLQITQQVCRFSVNSEDSKSQLNVRLKAIGHHIAVALAPRVLLPVISQVYETLVKSHQAGIASLMAILKEHITTMSKENLKAQMGTLQGLFMEALDFRSTNSKDDLDKAKEVEDHVLDALQSLVMRLSEVSFRPLFLKLYNWATRESAQEERLLTFYQMTDMLAEKMKSIFTLFAGHMIKNCAELLDSCNSVKSDKPVFKGAKHLLLLQSILSTLYKVFLYDKEGFVSKERFEVLMMPLLDQVENSSLDYDAYQGLIGSHLTPCIAQMMTSAQDTGCWQPLNYQLLLKTRNPDSKVRYATLVILEEVHRHLGEEFLTLLPETLPFLSELLEDESTEVEIQCQKVIGQLENTLGEPLQKYF